MQLKGRRELAGLTQEELAQRAGVSAAAIRDLEQRRSRSPRPQSTQALAEALGLTPDQVVEFRRAAVAARAADRPPARPAERDAAVTIGVLGPLVVHSGPAVVPVGKGRRRLLLGRLALTPGTTVHRDELIDLLWGNDVPPSAVNLVQTYVSRLRRTLARPGQPRLLVSVPGGYRLNAGADQLDLVEFRQLVADARATTGLAALALLERALDLWRDEPLVDVDELRADPTITALVEERVAAAIQYARCAEELSRHEQTLPRLRHLARRHPLDEPLHARLVTALAATGRQAAALDAYREIRQRLADELGIDPGPELIEIHRDVLRQRWRRPAEAESPPAVPSQVPAPPADFTGRREELRALTGLLGRDPDAPVPAAVVICVLTGTAGVGKTTLALRAAAQLRYCFPDGQLYVDLHGPGPRPAAPVAVLAQFLRALGIEGRAIPRDEAECAALFRSTLADRRVLLVLDNARDAAQLRPLVPGSGGCAVLVTSRRRLSDLAGAAVIDVGVLAPAEALEMLASSAGRARVAAEPEAAQRLATACGLLPLALRVAAGRLASRPSWTIGGLVERIADERHRLDELRVGDVAVGPSFQLSYHDLPSRTARAFRLLALAPGPDFTPAVAAALLGEPAAAVEQHLDVLADGNLLQVSADGRYRYHDLLHLYAERLARVQDRPATRAAALRRLLGWYLGRTVAAMQLVYPEMVRLPADANEAGAFDSDAAAMAWLDAELPALVAAVEVAAERGPRAWAWQIADQLRGYFFLRRHAQPWLATGLAGLAAARALRDERAQAAMHQTVGQAHWSVGRTEAALGAYERALGLAESSGWLPGAAYLRHNIGLVQAEQGRVAQAQESFQHVLEVSSAHGLDHVRALTLTELGVMDQEQGRLAEAAGHFAEAVRLTQDAPLSRPAAANRSNLGMVLRQLGRMDEAREHLEVGLAGHRRLGNHYGEFCVLDELSQLYAYQGDHAAAVSAAERGLELAREMGDPRGETILLSTLGEALLGAGATAEAQRRLGESHELASRNAYPYYQVRARIGLARVRLATGHLGPAIEDAAAAREAARSGGYRVLAADAAVALARGHLALGRREQAAELCRAALADYRATGSPLQVDEATRILASAAEPSADERMVGGWQRPARDRY